MIDQVKVISEAGIGCGTRVVDVSTGEELQNIERVAIPSFGASDVVRVELVLGVASIQVNGAPTFRCVHPKTGNTKNIRSIVFEDGEVWP